MNGPSFVLVTFEVAPKEFERWPDQETDAGRLSAFWGWLARWSTSARSGHRGEKTVT